jgi:hypothetical protein
MKATVNWIRNISRERAEKVRPLYVELGSVVRDDAKPAEYRQRRQRELLEQIDNINATYDRRIRETAMEAMEEPQRLFAAGSPLKPEQLSEAQLIVEQYRSRPARQERQQLVADIAEALKAGDTAGARVMGRAAAALNIPLGSVATQLNLADPVKKDAHDSMTLIEGLALLALNEPLRERAAAGLANVQERLFLKAFAHDRSLRPDAPFPDQVEPGYSGPDVNRHGTPANPFPEPHDPERDRLRERAERNRTGGEPSAAAEARYHRRDQS